MSRIQSLAWAAASTLLVCVFFARPALADPHTEAAAKDALQKASADYASAAYPAAVTKLSAAVKACGTKACPAPLRATLLRDLGTMQFRAGDKNGSAKSFGDALTLDTTLSLNPTYDASDVGAAWEDARASAGLPAGNISTKAPPGGAAAPAPAAPAAPAKPAAPVEPPPDQPTGDFEHDPAPEQRENTPLPIHVEYPGNGKLSRVLLKYKGTQMRDWSHIEMKHVEGTGYEATIPCGDVTRGMMKYWVQGFDKSGEPAAATGDPKHPYAVYIREKITTEPPHLPGKEAPKSCEETDCPPGLAGCKRKSEGAAPEGGGAGAGEGTTAAPTEGGETPEKKDEGPPFRRVWLGVSLGFEWMPMPSGNDVCRRDMNTGVAINTSGLYCYDGANGADFPAKDVNNLLAPNGAGTTKGGLVFGDVRLLVALDYALSPNFLVGGRLGYVFNGYPGKATVHFAPIHIEARATYLFGSAPLTRPSIAPVGFAGLGVSQFDAHQSSQVRFTNTTTPQTVDVWLNDVPFFLTVGAGIRWQTSPHLALTAAGRVNVVIGNNGVIPTVGPEVLGQYAF